ncbi:chitinase [Holotrichia oblita]|uniref:Chitinase n=1 Tax=Holotrichia oblita TaxID=644536 RepID=A0ACB9TLP3_HOLOL|nr:chitinase [Holotrichia oblita]
MGYNEICMELNNQSLNYTQHWDNESKTPFAVSGRKVISYDNPKSITEKVKFAMQKGLAGCMIWSIDTDDFHGDYSHDHGYRLNSVTDTIRSLDSWQDLSDGNNGYNRLVRLKQKYPHLKLRYTLTRTLFCKELRAAFNRFNYLLTAAFGAGKDTIDTAYDVRGLSKYLDFIHMMCYDYHGAGERTRANAPLASSNMHNVIRIVSK